MLALYSLGKDLEEGMGKQNMKTRDEMAADSLDGDRTITYDYAVNQEQDDGLEVESAMILPAMVEKEKISDSEATLEGNSFGNIAGHGYTDLQEVDSDSRAKRAVSKSRSLRVGFIRTLKPGWLEEIDSGEGVWIATKKYRSNGKADKVST
jgi:hypothetical protein